LEKESEAMRRILQVVALVLAFFLMLPALTARAAAEQAAKVETATDVLNKIMAIPEQAIPPALLANAQGIAVVPGVIKLGFVLGGQYGTGVLVVREKGGGWSDPVFVKLMSGSVGWQIGAESTDFVLVFKTHRGIDGIMRGKYTLGADAGIAAGPVGRRATASTDIRLNAEIYSYSRSRGLFAGLSLEGSSLQIDNKSNQAYYGLEDIRPSEILSGKGFKVPRSAEHLKKALETYAPAGR
jgi:lipid-binding SYLF domain-containing protein